MKVDPGIIDDFRENWNIQDESLDHLINVMEPAKEFGLDDEYRRYFEVEASSEDDAGWNKFQNELLNKDPFRTLNISYSDYLEWEKGGMKLGKFLAKALTKYICKEYGHRTVDIKTDLLMMFYREELDSIGASRVKGKVNTVMLTQNPADLMLCSMHPAFRSCMSLKSTYGQWRAIPANIWNPNVAMLVLLDPGGSTSYTLKNGHEINVPKILGRTWVFLMEDEDKKQSLITPRYYDKKFVDTKALGAQIGMPIHYKSFPMELKTPHTAVFPKWLNKERRYVVTQPYFDGAMMIDNFDQTTLEYDIVTSNGASGGGFTIDVGKKTNFYGYRQISVGGSYAKETDD